MDELQKLKILLLESKYPFFTDGLEICDTLKMARQVLGKMPTYRNFCVKNGYLTKNNRCI